MTKLFNKQTGLTTVRPHSRILVVERGSTVPNAAVFSRPNYAISKTHHVCFRHFEALPANSRPRRQG